VSTNESASADATDVDSAGVARLVNAIFEDRIPVIHRLGIRRVGLPSWRISWTRWSASPRGRRWSIPVGV
jgi:hypothetical protein